MVNKKVTVIPIVVNALGTVSKDLENYIEQLGITIRLEHLQKTALLGTARILRKVIEEQRCYFSLLVVNS